MDFSFTEAQRTSTIAAAFAGAVTRDGWQHVEAGIRPVFTELQTGFTVLGPLLEVPLDWPQAGEACRDCAAALIACPGNPVYLHGCQWSVPLEPDIEGGFISV